MRKWLKRIVLIFLIVPILFFGVLIMALYIPTLQNYLKKEITLYASQATGMELELGRIDLRYPFNLLLKDLSIKEGENSLLSMKSLDLQVKMLPLLAGRVDVNKLTLRDLSLNTQDKINGLQIQGDLGYLFIQSRGIDIKNEEALVNVITIRDTDFTLRIDSLTSSSDTTTSTPINWIGALEHLELKNINIDVSMPLDSINIGAFISDFNISGVNVDLANEIYALNYFDISKTSLSYQKGEVVETRGFNPENISLSGVHVALDSLYYKGKEMKGVLTNLSFQEHSGLHLASAKGNFKSDSLSMDLSDLFLETDYSSISVKASSSWEFIDDPQKGNFEAQIKASLASEDLFVVVSDFPEKFKQEFPEQPFDFSLNLKGNTTNLLVNSLAVNWPQTLSVTSQGKLSNVLNETHRRGDVQIDADFQNLNFITSLFQSDSTSLVTIPPDISLFAKWKMAGSNHQLNLNLNEDKGEVSLAGTFNDKTESFEVDLLIDSLQIPHFISLDSLGEFSAQASLKGKGLNIQSPESKGDLNLTISQFSYGVNQLALLSLFANWQEGLLKANLSGDNDLLYLEADAEYYLTSTIPKAKVDLLVNRLNLSVLSLSGNEFDKPLDLTGNAELTENWVSAHIESGDFGFDFKAPNSMLELKDQIAMLMVELDKQMDNNYQIYPSILKKSFPTVELKITSQTDNLIAELLQTKGIRYQNLNLDLSLDTLKGLQSYGYINNIRVDKNVIDTFLLNLNQDEEAIHLETGFVKKTKKGALPVFKSLILGKIGEGENEVRLYYENEKGERGVDLGVFVVPQDSGFYFHITPEKPIIAFKDFQYGDNQGFLRNDLKLNSLIQLYDKEGVGFQLNAHIEDSTRQVANLEVQHIELAELTRAIPFLPDISGLFSIEAHTFDVDNFTFISAEASIDELNYEKNRIGDVALGMSWFPDGKGNHYLDSYLHHEGKDVLAAEGKINLVGKEEKLDITTQLHHFPLVILNSFIPDGMLTFQGDLDGELAITGNTTKPQINGGVELDSVSIFSSQWGVNYYFDNKPLVVTKNQLTFDKFSIYTTSKKNPFIIDGVLSFVDLSNPTLNVHLKANDYDLLDAKRTKKSLVYGKVVVDIDARVKGLLSELEVRGDLSLNNKTDVTYVLKDSPLTVKDRLGELVTFTSFSDTLYVEEDTVSRSLGGMSLLMNIHIDPTVLLKVDISEDRSSRVRLEGGGDLTLQYTPQGDLTLSGRYTLSGGLIRYSLPVIPLEDFKIIPNSYVEWTGNPMNPKLDIKASERLRASVIDENDNSRKVNFDLSVLIKNRVDDLSLKFDIEAPEDGEVQKLLATMTEEERLRQAVVMMTTGRFMAADGGSSGGNFDMGTALNSVLQNQINAISDKIENVSFSVGVEEYDETSGRGKHTDYSFSYSQRFFNNRVQVVIGGKVSTGENVENDVESFIDNISIEYRLDNTATRYVRVFHKKNYDNILEGEIIETGVGLILRRKVDRLGELFIFKKKKDKTKEENEHK